MAQVLPVRQVWSAGIALVVLWSAGSGSTGGSNCLSGPFGSGSSTALLDLGSGRAHLRSNNKHRGFHHKTILDCKAMVLWLKRAYILQTDTTGQLLIVQIGNGIVLILTIKIINKLYYGDRKIINMQNCRTVYTALFLPKCSEAQVL